MAYLLMEQFDRMILGLILLHIFANLLDWVTRVKRAVCWQSFNANGCVQSQYFKSQMTRKICDVTFTMTDAIPDTWPLWIGQ